MSRKPNYSYKALHNQTSESEEFLEDSDASESSSKLVKDLNEVKNPFFMCDEKLSNNNIDNENRNNNAKTSKIHCSHIDKSHQRSSILNVLKSTWCDLKTKNQILKKAKEKSTIQDTSGNKIDISLNEKDQIELKMLIPKDCLSQNDIKALEHKKMKQKRKLRKVESRETRYESSSDECDKLRLRKSSSQVNYTHHKPPRRICLFIFSFIGILFNPIFGFISLLAVLKIKKCRDENESKQLALIARKTSMAGILLSLILISLSAALYFLHDKFYNFVKLNQFFYRNSNNNNTNKSDNALNFNSSSHSKHKLHYQITHLAEIATSTSSQRFIRNNESSLNQTQTVTTNTQISNQNSTRIKYYDRLNILIDHDLLEILKQKYKIN